jgi:hypothetical protein
MSGIHSGIVGVCCSSSTQSSLLSSFSFLPVVMIKPQLPKEDQEKVEIATGIMVDDEQLEPGSDEDDM